MCRLLAYVSPAPRSLRDAVQEPTLTSFRALARIHRDGWGMAWAQPGTAGGLEVRRSTRSAAEDPGFLAAATEVEALAGFLHLRWASEGFAIAPANTHPFVADGWAFAHNGFVRGAEHIEAMLVDRHRGALAGTTDSERYFRFVLQCAERTGDMLTGIQLAAQVISELSGAVSLNAMVLSSTRLLAVQGLTGANPPRDDLLAMVDDPALLPQDHLDGYFRLGRRYVGDALVIASSGMPRDDWIEQLPNTVMDINVISGEWQLHPLIDALPPEPIWPTPSASVKAV
jgi:predicted glutamine amidotransferase